MPICQNPKKKTVSPEVIGVAPPAVSKKLMKRSSRFIRNVYETDPLSSLPCHGEMQIISFIDQPEVTKKDLTFDPCSARLKTSLLQTEINVHLYPGIELELT